MITIFQNKPGIQRDGTRLDSARYVDGQWVRFQRGKPKKMGGYRRIINNVNGPVYGTHVWTRQSTNLITLFSGSGIEQVQVNNDFIGATVYDRTPANWVTKDNVLWQFATLYDSAANSNASLIIAHASNSLRSIDDGTVSDVYYGNANGNEPLVPMGPECRVSGGVVAAAPYMIYYGSDGKVTWSNQNEPRNVLTGDAGTNRATDKKIVRGLQIRGTGRSPSVLLWSLDSLILMSYIGGTAVFSFDTVTNQISILSANSVIEYDGRFFWVGIDRFMMYDGSAREIPNDTNLNYFFDNLNFNQRQKVFAIKVPRFGEIWWFYPSGDSVECDRAVILNVREETWYDVELNRTSGSSAQTVRNPIMVDSDSQLKTIRVRLTSVTGQFLIGDTVVGSFSNARGTVMKVVGATIYLKDVQGIFRSSPSETVTSANGSASTSATDTVNQFSVWAHETGYNRIEGDYELSIRSFIETTDFSFLTGGPATVGETVVDAQTRINYLEPDFVQVGDLTLNILGQAKANSPETVSKDYVITPTTERVTMREQKRIIRMRLTSDTLNGDFEMGKVVIDVEPGDGKA